MGMEAVIKEIVATEEQAQSMLDSARVRADECAMQERLAAQKLMAEWVAKEKETLAQQLAEKESELAQRQAQEAEQNARLAEEITTGAQQNMERAVSFLMGRMLQ